MLLAPTLYCLYISPTNDCQGWGCGLCVPSKSQVLYLIQIMCTCAYMNTHTHTHSHRYTLKLAHSYILHTYFTHTHTQLSICVCKKQPCWALSVVAAVRLGSQGQLKALVKEARTKPIPSRDGTTWLTHSFPRHSHLSQPLNALYNAFIDDTGPFIKSWGWGGTVAKLSRFSLRFYSKAIQDGEACHLSSSPVSVTYKGRGVKSHPLAVDIFQLFLGKVCLADTFPGGRIALGCLNN